MYKQQFHNRFQKERKGSPSCILNLEAVRMEASSLRSWCKTGEEPGKESLFLSPGEDKPTSGPAQTCSLSSLSAAAAASAAKSLQSCPTLCHPTDGKPTRLPRPWDSPEKNTGVGCHFLLQCIKVKSESEVAQSCLTRMDPMDCSLPGFSIHGIFQARVLEWGAIAFSFSYLLWV